jgi:DMSO reductase anchor subunit
VPSRPAWNTRYTLLQFNLTAALLGPVFAAAIGAGEARWLAVAAATTAGAQFTLLALRFFRCIASDSLELNGTARLLSTVLARPLIARGMLLMVGGIALPLAATTGSLGPLAGVSHAFGNPAYVVAVLALASALAGEIIGRYLFFVSVVPKHMAAPYLPETEAA